MVVTPGKNFEGQIGFPTPTDKPDNTACRIFVVPDNDEWLGTLMGAVELLLNPHNWYNWGELSIDDTVDAWAELVESAYARSLLSQCSVAVPAPWWDTPGDSDDEMDAAVQPWYGYVTFPSPALLLDDPPPYTFIERVQDWVIAGFIAYSGQIAGAIFFLTIAPKFRLAWKTGNLGGIVRIFIDAVEYGRVDTHSDTPGEVHFDVYHTDPDLDEHEVVVINDSGGESLLLDDVSPVMQLIRKKLDPAEIAPPQVRYNPECDCVESDYDGDNVWQENPGLDIRSNPAYLFPPVEADDPKCQAAANMTRYVSDFINDVATTLGYASVAEGLLTTVMGAIAIVFPEGAAIGVFALLGLDLATGLFSAGVTAIQAAFDNDTLDLMTCIFDCAVEPDGSVTPDDLATINSQADLLLNSLAALTLHGMFLLMGNVGLSNAGARGDAPADCSACDCCPDGWCTVFDFTIDDYGWAATLGTYSPGVGWVAADVSDGGGHFYRGVWMDAAVLAGNVTEIEVEFAETPGTFVVGLTDRIWQHLDLSGNWLTTSAAGSTSSPFTWTGTLDDTDRIGVTITCGFSTVPSGSLTITKITARGDNCTIFAGGVDCL